VHAFNLKFCGIYLIFTEGHYYIAVLLKENPLEDTGIP
jgi:hypothetical protein